MTTTPPIDLNALELEAVSHFSLHQYNQAEQLYRRILQTRSSAEGIDAARRDQFNLASVLVREEKFGEAEPMLRELLEYLEARSVRNRKHFVQQEAATVTLLALAIGEGRDEEKRVLEEKAKDLEGAAEGMAE